MTWRTLPWVVLDVETTGLDWCCERVVELGVSVMVNGKIVDGASWLINPEVPIPEEVSKVHGISDEMVATAPLFAEVGDILTRFVEAQGEVIFVGYNGRFDALFVASEYLCTGGCTPPWLRFPRCQLGWIDPLPFVWSVDKYATGKGRHRLSVCAERWGLEVGTSHRAQGDCETTARVLDHLSRIDGLMPDDMDDLLLKQRRMSAEKDLNFFKFIERNKREKRVA